MGTVGTGVETNEVYTNFTQGAMKQTENDFDVALEGRGFLTVQTPQGERLTRNGAFLRQQRRVPRDEIAGTSCWARRGPSS